jgi:RNA polymerase-binding transcription factor DksA
LQVRASPSIPKKKKDTGGFSLSDVRSILSTRSKTVDEPNPTEAKSSTEKDSPKKRSSMSKAKTSKVKKIQTASIDDILGLSLSAVSQRPIRDEKKVPKELFSYYNDLMDLRASLKGALGERSSETLGASARESSGELSLNSSDAGTETFNRDVALSMVASEQEALEEIEDAIDRIFDGTFGICQETGKPIKKARLKVVPFTRFSLEGQNLFEKRKRRDGEPVSGAFATISDSTMGQDE